jgi:hypothetical protein
MLQDILRSRIFLGFVAAASFGALVATLLVVLILQPQSPRNQRDADGQNVVSAIDRQTAETKYNECSSLTLDPTNLTNFFSVSKTAICLGELRKLPGFTALSADKQQSTNRWFDLYSDVLRKNLESTDTT